jgi:hypothetical protein
MPGLDEQNDKRADRRRYLGGRQAFLRLTADTQASETPGGSIASRPVTFATIAHAAYAGQGCLLHQRCLSVTGAKRVK